MALDIDDGYTLEGIATADGIEPVKVRYRPALPEAIYTFNYNDTASRSGAEQLDVAAKFIADHVVSWDVMKGGSRTEPTPKIIRLLPFPMLQAIIKLVSRWAPKSAESAGNSHAG